MTSPSSPNLHSRREALRVGAKSGLGLAFAGELFRAKGAQAEPIKSSTPGSAGPLRSAGAMTFGPDNVLFVGDIAGSAIHAFALREEDVTSQTSIISKGSTWSAAWT
jgi:hypothetical protein